MAATASAADIADRTHSTQAASLRNALGTTADRWSLDPASDLNADGVINILDVARLRLQTGEVMAKPSTVAGTSEEINVELQTTFALPGSSASVLFLIRNNVTPLLGYSLDVDVVPVGNARGMVTADLAATNFYDVRNLISAGGATRDPFFSVISDGGDGGVFINTITDDNSTVLAAEGVNDVLAQVFFNVSAEACGIWSVQLGQASALSDGNASSVPYTQMPGTLVVTGTADCSVPTVSDWGIVVMALSILTAGTVAASPRPSGVSAS